jgi:hypothetical protein
MVDKSTQLMVEALARAVAEPSGLPLHGSRTEPGLFNGSPPARQAAQRCKDQGYVTVVRSEVRGKAAQEICAITDKGLEFLLGQVSPRKVLEDFLRSLDARQVQLAELLATARQIHTSLEDLKTLAGKVLPRLEYPKPSANGTAAEPGVILAFLAQWYQTPSVGDCPLPELYRQARPPAADWTIGHFHDELRRLHEEGQIYLHPWTGPLYDLPEPPYALLIGHEVAYYASLRH